MENEEQILINMEKLIATRYCLDKEDEISYKELMEDFFGKEIVIPRRLGNLKLPKYIAGHDHIDNNSKVMFYQVEGVKDNQPDSSITYSNGLSQEIFMKQPIQIKNNYLEEVQDYIDCVSPEDKGKLSDGYHTFDELYEFRKMYNAALFNEWATDGFTDKYAGTWVDRPKYNVHKSWKHYDGELCFGGGWFIVSAMLPTGLISNHYKEEDWSLFKVSEVEKALFPFDGHNGSDVLERLKQL